MNHALILATQLALNGAREPRQCSGSHWHQTIDKAGKLWLEQDYQIRNRHLEKEDVTIWHGPFTPEEWQLLDFIRPIAAGTMSEEQQT